MSLESGVLQQHVDVFVNSFFLNGTRNHIRKATRSDPWISVGIMEKVNSEAFYSSKLFGNTNIVGGSAYSLGHGLIHGYLKDSVESQIESAVANLNALPAEEIIFYHDESLRGLDKARGMGLELRFTPITLLEWLIRKIKDNPQQIHPVDADVAVQLPCSWQAGDKKNSRIEDLFGLIGVRRVERKFDFDSRLCCGSRGYFGLLTGDTLNDSDRSEVQGRKNVEDAKRAGARYLVTTCPYCYAALASATKEAGMVPIQIEGLASLALYNEPLPDGLAFL